MADFRLNIVTAQRTVFDEDVTALTLPGEQGYFGLLAHHAPIVAVLGPGKLTVRRGNREDDATINGGFLEMSNNVATLLIDDVTSLGTLIHEKSSESE
jgi:F-type H+-transporting ATPase subunit epsilon